MALKNFWSKTGGWLRSGKLSKPQDYPPQINDEGLISPDLDSAKQPDAQQADGNSPVVVKKVQPDDKNQSLEKLHEGFNNLIEQLRGINEHLDSQATRHEDLMTRIEKLPQLLESFPAVVENQKQLTEQLLEQLKAASVKEQQFVEAVEKIPVETAKQTDALTGIDHQLAAAADADVQMTESFNRFYETLDKLDQNTIGQTDSIIQMSKTFATSDRYLKYLVSRQNKRFMWIFITAMSICVLVILIFTGIIIYLRQ